jgi:preprotein translocase subunit YajC
MIEWTNLIALPLADLFRLALPFILLYILHLTFIVLPQKKELRRHAIQSLSLRIGDIIVTSGGLRGTIIQKTATTIIISLFNGALAEIEHSGVAHVVARKN